MYHDKRGPFNDSKYEIYEANIPPLLRYYIFEVSPSVGYKSIQNVYNNKSKVAYEFFVELVK